MNELYIRPVIACAIMLGLLSAAARVHAQQTGAGGAGVLEQIIVTAQKRAERLQDVPVSVSVLGAESLQSGQILRLQDYDARVPGLAMNTGSGGHVTLAIRGTSGWTATAFVHNVTDERGLLSAEPEVASGATGVYILNVIRPRAFGLSLSREF